MKHLLIASLLFCLTASAHAQTAFDVQIAIAIANANAEAAQPAARTSSPSPPLILPAVKAAGLKPKTVRAGYPTRGGYWSGCPNWTHLTRSEHAGKFDQNWLRSLNYAEIQSLHADDHEGRTKWAYVVRPSTATATVTYQQSSSGCPGGVCPSSSRSRGFRLFRR